MFVTGAPLAAVPSGSPVLRTLDGGWSCPNLRTPQRKVAPGGGSRDGTQPSFSGRPRAWQGGRAGDSGPGLGHSPSTQAAQSPVDIPLQQPLQQGTELGGEGVGQLHSLWGGVDVGRGQGRDLAPSTGRDRAQLPPWPPWGTFVLTTQGRGASGAGGHSKDQWPKFAVIW